LLGEFDLALVELLPLMRWLSFSSACGSAQPQYFLFGSSLLRYETTRNTSRLGFVYVKLTSYVLSALVLPSGLAILVSILSTSLIILADATTLLVVDPGLASIPFQYPLYFSSDFASGLIY